VGVAVRADGFFGYYPVRHAQGNNFAPNVVFPWLAEQLSGEQPKIGANLLYDLEGLWYEGVTDVRGKMRDVQVAEPLLDEDSDDGYSLNVLAKKYLGKEKREELLREAARMHIDSFKSKRSSSGVPFDPKKDLWRLPPEYVGPYAEVDTLLPVEILEKQKKLITEDAIDGIFELESSLIPILLRMRIHGTRVDMEAAHALAKDLTKDIDEASDAIKKLVGFHVNVDAGQDIAKAYEKFDSANKSYGLASSYAYTVLGNKSFTKAWLLSQTDPLSTAIAKKRKLMTMRDDFVLGDIIGESVDGRVHAQFHQLRQDDRGTRSGRFSSTNPNLQQVPARDEYWAPKIRGLFIPDEGKRWLKADYSQQELRLLVHFALKCKLQGAEEIAREYRKNPKTDYHSMPTSASCTASALQNCASSWVSLIWKQRNFLRRTTWRYLSPSRCRPRR
jgi:DNA polymerase I-like protein with 3'-5' exonuclease and polymerase domains